MFLHSLCAILCISFLCQPITTPVLGASEITTTRCRKNMCNFCCFKKHPSSCCTCLWLLSFLHLLGTLRWFSGGDFLFQRLQLLHDLGALSGALNTQQPLMQLFSAHAIHMFTAHLRSRYTTGIYFPLPFLHKFATRHTHYDNANTNHFPCIQLREIEIHQKTCNARKAQQ